MWIVRGCAANPALRSGPPPRNAPASNWACGPLVVRLPRNVAFGREVEVTIVRSGDVLSIYSARKPIGESAKLLDCTIAARIAVVVIIGLSIGRTKHIRDAED